MRLGTRLVLGAAAMVMVLGVGVFAADEEKPKYTIKDVMKAAHKEGLLKKVGEGKAEADDKKKLQELYEALAKNEPKKGEKDEWKKKTEVIVVAVKEVVDGKKGSEKKLVAAVNCKACHDAHK